MRWLTVILLLLASFLIAAAQYVDFKDTVVQVYTKMEVAIETLQSTEIVIIVNGQEVERRKEEFYGIQETIEVWVLGSGFIVWSDVNPNTEERETLIMTNYHVIAYIVNPPESLTEITNDETITVGVYKNGKLERLEKPANFYRFKIKSVDGPYLLFYKAFKKSKKLLFEVKAEVDKYDALLDVAVLKLENVTGLPRVYFADSIDDYDVGTEILIFGAPLGIPFQLTKGILGQKHLDAGDGWNDMIRYDCPQAPGSSGSAIFEFLTKKVIGMVRGSYVTSFGSPYDGQHLGISVDNIKDWLFYNGYQFILEGGEEE